MWSCLSHAAKVKQRARPAGPRPVDLAAQCAICPKGLGTPVSQKRQPQAAQQSWQRPCSEERREWLRRLDPLLGNKET